MGEEDDGEQGGLRRTARARGTLQNSLLKF